MSLALGLEKYFSERWFADVREKAAITIVDKHDYQLLGLNLYEVATSPEEFVPTQDLVRSVCLPLSQALAGTAVTQLKGEVSEVNAAERWVLAGNKRIPYDCLVLAPGSRPDFAGTSGAGQYSVPLATLKDALNIRNRIESAFQAKRYDVRKEHVQIVVVGGGYEGVEFMAELSHEIDMLCWKHQYPRERVQLVLAEAGSELLPGVKPELRERAYWRLFERGVRILLSAPITEVTSTMVSFSNGERIVADVVVWAAGTRGATEFLSSQLPLDNKGRVVTDECLRVQGHDRIFALGDGARAAHHRPYYATVQNAVSQAKYLSRAIPLLLQNKHPGRYRVPRPLIMVTLGGKCAAVQYRGFTWIGLLGYVLRGAWIIRYLSRLVGWWRALRLGWFQAGIYRRND